MSKLTKLITVYSREKDPLEISKTMAFELENNNTLIIDLDELNNVLNKTEGLSDLIFHYKENTLDTDKIYNNITIMDDYSIINGVIYTEDLNVVDAFEVANLIKSIKDKTHYENIIVSSNNLNNLKYVLEDANINCFYNSNEFNTKVEKTIKDNSIDEKKCIFNNKLNILEVKGKLFEISKEDKKIKGVKELKAKYSELNDLYKELKGYETLNSKRDLEENEIEDRGLIADKIKDINYELAKAEKKSRGR